jgi:hypothetical protein
MDNSESAGARLELIPRKWTFYHTGESPARSGRYPASLSRLPLWQRGIKGDLPPRLHAGSGMDLLVALLRYVL